MKKKGIRNIIFVILSLIIIIIIGIFNYSIDPYGLFKRKYYMNTTDIPIELLYTLMKSYKDYNYDTVIIGGSEVWSMFGVIELNMHYFDIVAFIGGMTNKQFQEIINNYLELHPKTKNVIIIINYIKLLDDYCPITTLPQFKKSYTIKELCQVLFSIETTQKSLNIYKRILKHKFNRNKKEEKNNDRKNYNEYQTIYYKPKLVPSFYITEENLNKLEKKNFKEIKDFIKMLEKKGVNYTLIIPPYSALYLSLINSNELWQEKIDNYKKYLVSIVAEDKKIYDFAFVNKYTSSNTIENKEALYRNCNHPSIIYGAKIFKILFDEEKADTSIYYKLNKRNINYIIKKENMLLKKYIKENKELVKLFLYLADNQKEEYFQDEIISIKQTPRDTQKEYEYLIEKAEEKMRARAEAIMKKIMELKKQKKRRIELRFK